MVEAGEEGVSLALEGGERHSGDLLVSPSSEQALLWQGVITHFRGMQVQTALHSPPEDRHLAGDGPPCQGAQTPRMLRVAPMPSLMTRLCAAPGAGRGRWAPTAPARSCAPPSAQGCGVSTRQVQALQDWILSNCSSCRCLLLLHSSACWLPRPLQASHCCLASVEAAATILQQRCKSAPPSRPSPACTCRAQQRAQLSK